MTKQVLSRIGQALLVIFITFTVAFFLLSALPSDAVMARYASPDLALSQAELEEIRQQYGADDPLITQYFAALFGFLTGNFGYSVQTGAAVSTMLLDGLPTTLALAVTSFVLAILLALAIAVVASLERGAWVANIFRSLPSLLVSLPTFWVGIILIQVISFQLGWVPVIEPSNVQALILPSITLAIPIAAPLAQVLIRSIDEVKSQPFVQVVYSRGASASWVFWRNVLRGAATPAVTMAGLLFGELVSGAVVTEAVFGLQGIGQMTVEAVAYRDTPVLLAIVVIAAATYILINLIVDLLYPVLDPRLRKERVSA